MAPGLAPLRPGQVPAPERRAGAGDGRPGRRGELDRRRSFQCTAPAPPVQAARPRALYCMRLRHPGRRGPGEGSPAGPGYLTLSSLRR